MARGLEFKFLEIWEGIDIKSNEPKVHQAQAAHPDIPRCINASKIAKTSFEQNVEHCPMLGAMRAQSQKEETLSSHFPEE